MKKEIKIVVYENGVPTLATEKVENYDEFTYYVGPCKGDKIRSYALYDKNTGLLVWNSKNKKALLERYESLKERYAKIREENYYNELINKYNKMLEKEKEMK